MGSVSCDKFYSQEVEEEVIVFVSIIKIFFFYQFSPLKWMFFIFLFSLF